MQAKGVSWLVALAVLACGNAERGRFSPTQTAVGGGTAVGGSSGLGGSGPTGQALVAVPSEMRRLNRAEYVATVDDVLGYTLSTASALLRQDEENAGFDNVASVQNMDPERYEGFLNAAEQVATDVFATPALRDRVVTCETEDDAACVRSIITSTGLRVFRRPLVDEEVAVYEKVYAAARTAGELHDGALQRVLFALLSSSQFLYRMEFSSGEPGTQPVGPYEIASRLSYLLWSSAPDDDLLDAAGSEALSADVELAAQFERMFADPRTERFVANFAGQWLRARQVVTHAVEPALHPEWTPELALAASAEVIAYFGEFVRQDQDWLGFLQGRAHYVDAPLGALYGVEVSGTETQRITIEEGERAGYLGLVGFLTVTSQDRRTSPTFRGVSIMQNLLCTPLPQPPAVVPPLDDPDPEPRTLRERVEQISENEDCAICHQLVDPLGLALENFDEVGRFRTTDAEGNAIDAHVTIPPSDARPVAADVNGLPGLSEWVTSDPRFTACVVEKLYTYGLGRAPDEIDETNLAALGEQWVAGPLTIRAALSQLVMGTPFRFRSDGGQP